MTGPTSEDAPPVIEQRYADRVEEQLAAVAQIARDLQAHIETRAQEIAGPLISATQERAASEITDVRAEARRQKQRHDDLERELRRQLDALAKANERLNREAKALREAVKRVDELKIWVNEERKGFMFAEDVWVALGECGSTATRYLASLARSDRDETAPLLHPTENEGRS